MYIAIKKTCPLTFDATNAYLFTCFEKIKRMQAKLFKKTVNLGHTSSTCHGQHAANKNVNTNIHVIIIIYIMLIL